LAQDRELQEKVYAEVVSVLESDDPTMALEHSHLQEFKFMEMVIKETLRLYPTVPIIGRKLLEDTEIGERIYMVLRI
jgi:cytochrome P450 family 4